MFSFVHEQKDHAENDLRRLRERRWQGCVSGNRVSLIISRHVGRVNFFLILPLDR